ncbi:SufB/SufD family protein [Vulcanisaeta souniana]|uniref:SufBD protein n=1 Tax=Vulcanisaeta souniana JCM 11219 TaxID=1293586 RepID=A0A830E6Z8_9CREN|nr:SufD family Fe-S cluster assembly protein [Vulcanisaeta souniana]BDR92503.1 SufBD protein [Vulcanisaeta souniana JCM 11219]GGI76009.1 SufBD protein [Vulcanisaeta souniana JCM 11219]
MSIKWFSELRDRARELAQKIPYQQIRDSPSVKYYTDWNAFERCIEPSPGVIADSPTINLPTELNVVSMNGIVSTINTPGGINVISLEELNNELGKLILKSIDISESKALARHAANLVGGAYIEIDNDLDKPLKIGIAAATKSPVLLPTHYTILVNDNIKASLSLFMLGAGGCPSTTAEIYLGEGSRLNILTVGMHEQVPSYALIKVIMGNDAEITARTLLIGGAMNHHREDYVLQGRNSSINHLGLEVGYGKSRIDYQVNIMHTGEKGTSYSRVLGIARDKSFVIHRALGRITDSAKWSDTSVEGKVFIMNEGAYAASVPIIMVDTGDVNGARHSAADASPDEDQVNYLRLRGIGRDEVTDLIIHEMISQFIESLPTEYSADAETLRSLIMSRILAKPQ